MIIDSSAATDKRAKFRNALNEARLLQFPGAYNPLVALAIERQQFDGVYVSGAVMANSLGLPDIGMTTLSEVTQTASSIAKVTSLPTIMDIDTGFGEPLSVMRTIKEIEFAGLSGCHLEDQQNPKRCGHLDGKQLVDRYDMSQKIRAAADAKNDQNFVIIARTDARGVEGLDSALERAKAYADAGADMIFPEALQSEDEFEAFRKAISIPLLANMTEFGKSKLLDKQTLENLGYNVVIYPVTTQRLALKAVEDGLKVIKDSGTQASLLDKMQTRSELYDLLRYEDYNQFDRTIYNFALRKDQ